MAHIEGTGYSVDIEWDKDSNPVQYVNCHGSVRLPREALDTVAASVKMIDDSAFKHVCVVYNLLDVQHIPHLARFIGGGKFPSSPKTAHIIMATTSTTLQLIGSLAAVTGSKRLRTMEVCRTPDEIASAVKHWLALPDRTKEYTIDNL